MSILETAINVQVGLAMAFSEDIKLKIYGMQPHDVYPMLKGEWSTLRVVSKSEAAELVRAPKEVHYKDYMWLNKGYFVLEMLDGYKPENLKTGMRAVYLCDGDYLLIQKK